MSKNRDLIRVDRHHSLDDRRDLYVLFSAESVHLEYVLQALPACLRLRFCLMFPAHQLRQRLSGLEVGGLVHLHVVAGAQQFVVDLDLQVLQEVLPGDPGSSEATL